MIRQLINNHNLIIKNAGYLTVIEVLKMVMPFIALPYIIRTIGADNYGLIAFVQSIITYFVIFINFGLDISAVREVALARDDKEKLDTIVSSVLGVKLILFLIATCVFLVALIAIPFFREHALLLCFAYIASFSEILFPVWYYQGMERMKYITIIRFISIVLYTISIFIFIRQSSDYLYLPLLLSVSSIAGGLLCVALLSGKEHIRFHIPRWLDMKTSFTESIPFFVSRLSVTVNSSLGKLLTGTFLSMELVAAYDLAQKIANMSITPLHMLNQAVYPHIAKGQSKKFASKFLFINTGLSFCVALGVFILTPFAVDIFAKTSMPQAVDILRILCLFVFFGGIAMYLGTPVLVAFKHPKPFNNSVLWSTCLLLIAYAVCYMFNIFNVYYFAAIAAGVELFIAAYRMYYCRKYHIFIFNMNKSRIK